LTRAGCFPISAAAPRGSDRVLWAKPVADGGGELGQVELVGLDWRRGWVVGIVYGHLQSVEKDGCAARDAARRVFKLINTGHREIVDADLTSYFDLLPHAELLKSVARRVVDGAMLHLIKMWLKAPVEETDECGRKRRNTGNRDQGKGTPQGSPISPMLSNLYMRRFVLGWNKLGHEKRFGACIVNYADDLVICCRGGADEALASMRVMMTKLKLTVNETKTRVAKLPEEKFDFLGYTFGRYYSPMTGRAHLGSAPSKKRVIRICRAISDETKRNRTQLDHETVVRKLNQMMIGWARITSAWVQPAKPIGRSNNMPVNGYVSGCA
jgi:RNA-directed DNA polymerase